VCILLFFNTQLFEFMDTRPIPKVEPVLSVKTHVYILCGCIKNRIASLRIVVGDGWSSCNSYIQKTVCVLTCLLNVTVSAFGSSVIAFRTISSIIIGSDSRQNDGKNVLPDAFCKVLQSGGVSRFWSSTQVWKEPLSGFSVEASVNRAATNATSMNEWVAAFDSGIMAELRRTIRMVKTKDITKYLNAYAGKHVLEIIFVGFEDKVPVLFFRDYQTDANGNLMPPNKVGCPGERCMDATTMRFCLGACTEADEVSRRSQPLRPNGLVDAIRNEINAEIKTDWTVGPPIDVLQIDQRGSRWVDAEPQSKCKPITDP